MSVPPPPTRRRVLIVDSDPTSRRTMKTVLESDGFDAEPVADGPAAMTALQRDRFHLVLLDATKPEIDAPGLIERIRASFPDTPVVVVTSTSPDDAALEAQTLGATSFLNKPLEMAEILAHISTVLGI